MRAFDRKVAVHMIISLLFFHALYLYLIFYFLDYFVFLRKDSGGFFLIAFVSAMIISLDVVSLKNGLYTQLFLKIKMTERGVTCYGLFIQEYEISWKSIRKYGVSTKYFTEPLIFISTIQNEQKKFRELFQEINKNRVVFQYSAKNWSEMRKFMPEDMWYRLNNAIQSGSDRVWKR
ncbi:MAG: hypothetical protein IKM61_00120 [Eubacteriaceae bacterium]|nr:hypothetical protein [Eubacteriaceae bacterium]